MTYAKAFGIRSITIACVILAFTLAASLGLAAATPGNAYAGAKTDVYVVSKIVYKSDDYKQTSKYTYKNGLVKTVKASIKGEDIDSSSSYTYTYNSKKSMKKLVSKSNGKTTSTTTFKTNSKGWVTKSTISYPGVSQKMTYKYTYKKGKLSKQTTPASVITYKYKKDGSLKSLVNKYDTESYTVAFTYDKQGSLKKRVSSAPSYKATYKYKNTYKNGRLVKQIATGDQPTETITYTYKKVSVPTSLANMVEAQQTSIIVGTLPIETAHK